MMPPTRSSVPRESSTNVSVAAMPAGIFVAFQPALVDMAIEVIARPDGP
jgi:hypothetical protein